jgi:hypothetical protein
MMFMRTRPPATKLVALADVSGADEGRENVDCEIPDNLICYLPIDLLGSCGVIESLFGCIDIDLEQNRRILFILG